LPPKDNPTCTNEIGITKGLTNLPKIIYISAREISRKPSPHQSVAHMLSLDIHEQGICRYLSQLGFFLVVNDKNGEFGCCEERFPLCFRMS